MAEKGSLNQQLGTDQVIWNLTDLYQSIDAPELESDIAWCKNEAAAINRDFKGSVATLSATQLSRLIKRLETLDSRIGSLATFGFLNFTTQVSDDKAGALYQRIIEIANQCNKDTVFFELEWNRLDESIAEQLLTTEQIQPYHHYLDSMRRYRPHQLEEMEERLLLELKSVGRKSWTTLFEKVIGNLRFGEQGRTEEEVLSDLYRPERVLRKQAAADLTEGLKSQSHILCHIYNTLAAEKMISDRLRNHQEWVSSMNLDNQISDETVTTLIESVVSRYDIVNRYYHLKKGLLGLDSLCDYDRYAPLPSLPSETIPWRDCRRMVLDSFSDFSEEMGNIAEKFFSKSWIHAPVRQGKRGGAFAHPCVPDVHPYVMVNYTGTLRDVSTVAHELGHGVHQVLASRKGYYNSDTPLVLAETASVFAELLIFKSQLEALTDPAEKRAFICQKLESIFATVFRQVAMNRFEQRMHQGRRTHGELSADKLGDYWLETQQEMFGDSVELRDDYRTWWSYIPHFLSTPGYVYSYAFGELLVLALYGIYKKSGSDFTEKYLALLNAGGSDTPYRLLEPFGIDLNDQSFWLQGLDVIDEMLQEVEQMG
ncbi:MAG: M3 family oligoendopeptidase [Desulfobulbaceae bacterium]|nr:MAG: M3 family oligoendopeptidase [Desulfobulbaceae bacterium]